MTERTIGDLARDLADRRRLGESPPVVLFGAGASVDAGIGAMDGIFKLVGARDFDTFVAAIESRGAAERYRLLAEFLQAQDPAVVTPGYRAFAALCANAYFDLVLTTNLDPLLDDALSDAKMWRRDYLMLVNGIIRADRTALLLRAGQPRVKVIKLHGDLFQRSMAWTPREMEQYVAELLPALAPAIAGRDVLVIGHSLRDEHIRDLVLGTGGEAIWYATPFTVPAPLAQEPRLRTLSGPECAFEPLLQRLATAFELAVGAESLRETPVGLELRPTSAAAHARSPDAETMDDLAASVVGVGPRGAGPVMSGFILAGRRLIVTDGWVGNVQNLGAEIAVFTRDGRAWPTPVLRHATEHPFGPLILAAPADLAVPGLRLDTAPLDLGAPVHIAVAAGLRRGLSDGTVATGGDVTVDVAPVGKVGGLVEVRAAVAPGSSGAPVVDTQMRVRGFVVAGSADPEKPFTFFYPAHRWAAAVETLGEG